MSTLRQLRFSLLQVRYQTAVSRAVEAGAQLVSEHRFVARKHNESTSRAILEVYTCVAAAKWLIFVAWFSYRLHRSASASCGRIRMVS